MTINPWDFAEAVENGRRQPPPPPPEDVRIVTLGEFIAEDEAGAGALLW